MKTLILFLIYTGFIFSQGMYLSRENGFSLGFVYGGNRHYNRLNLAATYSLFGFVDFSYTRSTFLNEENSDDFANEYFIRAYILKEKLPFFFSGSLGYIYQKAETELWNNFPLIAEAKGFAYEIGLHFSSRREENSPQMVASIIYGFFDSDEEIQVPTAIINDTKIIRSLVFEAAIIYYFSQFGIIVGPRFVFENNFNYGLYGLNLTFMFRH